jgi:TolB protein
MIRGLGFRYTFVVGFFILLLVLVSATSFAAQPDNTTHSLLAVQRFTNGRASDSTRQIYSMNPDGSNLQQVTHLEMEVLDASWSPDGSQLAITQVVGNLYPILDTRVAVVNRDGTAQRFLDTRQSSRATWSPNGQWIAYARRQDGTREWIVFLIRPDGSERINLTERSGLQGFPTSWSPDSRFLLVSSGRKAYDNVVAHGDDGDGWWNIYRLDVATGESMPLTSLTNASSGMADWSPDGSRIVFVSGRDGRQQIYMMSANGQNVQRLSDGEGNDWYPVWSPDGQFIAFSRSFGRASTMDIYRMHADGSDLINITNSAEDDMILDWSPLLPGEPPTPAPPTATPSPTLTPFPVTRTPSDLDCLDAPRSRLNLGMLAAVVLPTADEPERQNLRVRDAAGGEPLGLLEPGAEFYIVGGPVCGDDGLRWWEIETVDGSLRGWSAEGFAPDAYLIVPVEAG